MQRAELARAFVLPVVEGSVTRHVVQCTISCCCESSRSAVPKRIGWATGQREGGLINPCEQGA
jgi:hypothetical protein